MSAADTLAAIASSPAVVGESQAHLFAAIDALVAAHIENAPAGLTERQARMRNARAVWCAVYSHAEHRVHQLKRSADEAR